MYKFKRGDKDLLKKEYDFLDLGCKKGGSIEWCQQKYGGTGLGVDFSKSHIKQAQKNGFSAIRADVLNLDFPANSFRFVSMMDFLEHLSDEEAVTQVLVNCKKWAKEFFFIHHPSFEDIDYLKKFGLKIDWTDGYSHTCPLTINDFERIFKKIKLKNYKIEQTKPIKDSLDPHIIPLDAPHDTHFYDKSLGPKKKIKFDKPIFSRVELHVQTS